ncbi:MAG: class I SAM-dependent methyltransferase [Planctomycetota bacterium]|jgi:ubiquinone/menaquinone biosynthesis C-methylase UbiE
MHTKISADNPYGYNRWGFAWEYIPKGGVAHLDFGCHDGAFLNALKDKENGRLVGVDVSEEAVMRGQQCYPELEFVNINEAIDLPFDNGTFSSVTVLDVLEHVYKQSELLSELNRVLISGGRLIVTVPCLHVFSFLDMGNFKFRFPRLHRWYYCLCHSRQEYEYRYKSNPYGLIGDISARKRWHEHFNQEKLRKLLLEAGFNVTIFDGAGFFSRVIGNIAYLFRWIKPLYKVFIWFNRLDSRLFQSANLFCLAEKRQIADENSNYYNRSGN